DYVYIPLGGNRVPALRWTISIMIVFLLSGLWHGANWTFVVWGGLHGLYLITGAASHYLISGLGKPALKMERSGVYRMGQVIRTFLLVCVAWVFFRAASLQDAWVVLSRLGTGWNYVLQPGHFVTETGGVLLTWAILGVIGIALMQALEKW